MKTYLFIGGAADGQRMEKSGDPVAQIPVSPAPCVTRFDEVHCTEKPYPLELHQYRLVRSRVGAEVYLFKPIHENRIVPMLLEGYRKP